MPANVGVCVRVYLSPPADKCVLEKPETSVGERVHQSTEA